MEAVSSGSIPVIFTGPVGDDDDEDDDCCDDWCEGRESGSGSGGGGVFDRAFSEIEEEED